MDNKRHQFLLAASDIFMKYGIKSVTMDEMARQLGMSKKTIYTFVKDKKELVKECLDLGHTAEMEAICAVCETEANAIDEFIKVSMVVSNRLKTIHPSIFFDLQKYHTKTYHSFNSNTTKFIKETMVNNLNKGKAQGLYRENLNEDIVSSLYLSFTNSMFEGNTFPHQEYGYNTIHSEFFRYHIRGIASQKGLAYLKDIIKTKHYDI